MLLNKSWKTKDPECFTLQYSARSMWTKERCLWTLPYHTSFDTLLHDRSIMCHTASPHIISQRRGTVVFHFSVLDGWDHFLLGNAIHEIMVRFCFSFMLAASSLIGHAGLSWLSGFIIWCQGWNVQRAHVSRCRVVHGCGNLLFVCFCCLLFLLSCCGLLTEYE